MKLAFPYLFYGFFPFSANRGVSEEAGRIKDEIGNIWAAMYEKVATEDPRRKVLEALDRSVGECVLENWDGYGALPVNSLSDHYARRFLETLPPGLPNPDVGVDPDGEVSFEWFRGPRQVFSISVAANGDLSYAGLFGRNKVHGTESFDEDEIPRFILENLKRLFAR